MALVSHVKNIFKIFKDDCNFDISEVIRQLKTFDSGKKDKKISAKSEEKLNKIIWISVGDSENERNNTWAI